MTALSAVRFHNGSLNVTAAISSQTSIRTSSAALVHTGILALVSDCASATPNPQCFAPVHCAHAGHQDLRIQWTYIRANNVVRLRRILEGLQLCMVLRPS